MMQKTAKILASSMRCLNKTAELLDASRMFFESLENVEPAGTRGNERACGRADRRRCKL